ncbi:hypothetical protein LOTGIDRAFT_237845 [Lottia gigantea]|uniref:Uncharacterized protein n=1 Tax=Lottia gigantea TaxID=225164 RepID=V4AF95_LOTGI|nr:hypothetical protein LOTGIDRAFT_237845 [Lottia gigantea]ESP02694.1 hypothetical protein LOTGIDRAFT_237845 [Lottia gigantea]
MYPKVAVSLICMVSMASAFPLLPGMFGMPFLPPFNPLMMGPFSPLAMMGAFPFGMPFIRPFAGGMVTPFGRGMAQPFARGMSSVADASIVPSPSVSSNGFVSNTGSSIQTQNIVPLTNGFTMIIFIIDRPCLSKLNS